MVSMIESARASTASWPSRLSRVVLMVSRVVSRMTSPTALTTGLTTMWGSGRERRLSDSSTALSRLSSEKLPESFDGFLVGEDRPDLADQDLFDLIAAGLDGGAGDPDVGAVYDFFPVLVEDPHRHPVRDLFGDDVGDVGHAAAREVFSDPRQL